MQKIFLKAGREPSCRNIFCKNSSFRHDELKSFTMRRQVYYPIFLLVAFLFLLLTLPASFTNKVRRAAVSAVSPFWTTLHQSQKRSADMMQLTLENQRLHEALEEVFEWALAEEGVQSQLEKLGILSEKAKEEGSFQEFFARRKRELQQRVDLQLQSIPAKIIFRDPLSSNHFVWINVGERENESLGKRIIAVDSPVVVGDALVGVVEAVEKNRSKVRLITDSGLGISVRTARGFSQCHVLQRMIDALFPICKEKEDLFSSPEEKKLFLQMLLRVRERSLQEKREWFLAKGILQGANAPLWPFHAYTLKGRGFNYDCADAESSSQPLKTGTLPGMKDAQRLVVQGDLLITSGMDGVFPAGLEVATVTRVFPLQDGAYAYDLEAMPVVADLQDLTVVFVMPPLFTRE